MSTALSIGSIFDDKYEILGIAGSGGMGTVFKARHVDLGRFVALKIVNPTMVCDSDTIGRFEREAQILSNLSHPHIGRFFRFGISPEKLPYIEMEFIEGESLRQLLNKVDCLAWSRAVRIITQVCEAMDYAHKNAVLHRDLKPNNIVICTDAENEVVKVIDFGLAKLIARDEREFQKLTQTGTLLGSVQYMSPELCAGITLDQRADIYSLGCVLYECITGHLPHESDNPIGLMHKHVNEAVKKPSLLIKTQLPDRLDEVILKAVERDVLLRYQSMAEFRDDLLLVLSGEASRTTGGRSVTSALKKGMGDTSPISKLKLLLLLVSLLLLSLAIGAYYFAFTGRGLIHAYQIVAPYTSKQDRKKVDKFFSNRIEQFGAVADKEQFSSILYLSQRVSLDRVELALQFAKKELERKEQRRSFQWASKAILDLLDLREGVADFKRYRKLLNQYSEIMLALPVRYAKGMDPQISRVAHSVFQRDGGIKDEPFQELRIRVEIANQQISELLDRLTELCIVQLADGKTKEALVTIKRGQSVAGKGVGLLSEFCFHLAEAEGYFKNGQRDLANSKLKRAFHIFENKPRTIEWVATPSKLLHTCLLMSEWQLAMRHLDAYLGSAQTESEKCVIVDQVVLHLDAPDVPTSLDSWSMNWLRKLSKTTVKDSIEYVTILIHYAQRRLRPGSTVQDNKFIMSEIERIRKISLPVDYIPELDGLGYIVAYRLGDRQKMDFFDKEKQKWWQAHPDKTSERFTYYTFVANLFESENNLDDAIKARIESLKYSTKPEDRVLALSQMVNSFLSNMDARLDLYDLQLAQELNKQELNIMTPIGYRMRSRVATAKKNNVLTEELLLKALDASERSNNELERVLSLWSLSDFYRDTVQHEKRLAVVKKGYAITPRSLPFYYVHFRLVLAWESFKDHKYIGMDKVLREALDCLMVNDYYYQTEARSFMAEALRNTGRSPLGEKYASDAVAIMKNKRVSPADFILYLRSLVILGYAQHDSGKIALSQQTMQKLLTESPQITAGSIESVFKARMFLYECQKDAGQITRAGSMLAQIKRDFSQLQPEVLRLHGEKLFREYKDRARVN